MSSNTEVGRQGEFLAAYILETYGVECHYVNRTGADLWCLINGTVRTVEIKSASAPQTRRPSLKTARKSLSTPVYAFSTGKKSAEFFCFVALDRQIALVRPATSVTAKTTRIPASEFNAQNQSRTIDEMLKT
jgi:hypothetical protein